MKRLFRILKLFIGFILSFFLIFSISDLINVILEKVPILSNFQTSILDFRIIDIGYQNIWKHGEKRDDIILINFGQTSRDTIGLTLSRIAEFKPKVIGINSFFREPKTKYGDSLLAQGILDNANIVLMGEPHNYLDGAYESMKTSNSLFTGFDHVSIGHNILSAWDNLRYRYGVDQDRCVRYYDVKVEANDKEYYHFSLEILKRYDSLKFLSAISSDKWYNEIKYKYAENEFTILNYRDIVISSQDLKFLKDKIVIVGYLGISNNLSDYRNLEDRLITPLNSKIVGDKTPDTYSILINANILAMNLDMDFISNVRDMEPYSNILVFIIYLSIFLFLVWLFKKYQNNNYVRYAAYGLIASFVLAENLLYFYLDLAFDTREYIMDLILLPELIGLYYGKLMPYLSNFRLEYSYPFFKRR